MRRLHILFILALLIFGNLEFLSAQQARHAAWLDLWFLQARFSESDKNKDKQLSYSEMEAFPDEWAYFLIDEFFTEADLNQDGFLSETETWRRLGSAHEYRVKLDAALVAELREQYPYFDDAKLVYFKRHPELTSELFSNLSWLRLHPDIAYKLLANSSWWRDNPEVIQALGTNLTGLAEQPAIALRFFELPTLNRFLGPDQGFRAGYKLQFIDRKREQSYHYRISFYDEDIPEQQLEDAPLANNTDPAEARLSDPKLPAEAASLQAEADQLNAELQALIARLQEENKVLKSAEETLQKQIEDLNGALREAAKRPDQEALALLQRRVAELSRAKNNLEQQLNQAVFAQRQEQLDNSKQIEEVEALKGQIVQLEEENGRLQRLMRSNSSDLRTANQQQEAQIRQLQGVIAQMGSQLDRVSQTENSSSADIARYQQRIQSLQAELQSKDQDLQHVKSSWTTTAQNLAEVNDERRRLKLTIQNLEAQQMVKTEQLNQRLENQQLDQEKYQQLLSENEGQKTEIARLKQNLAQIEQNLVAQNAASESKTRQEVEALYLNRLQAQINRSDSIARLNAELSKQVDELQMQFVQMETTQANANDNNEASLERLEKHYQTQTQGLKAEVARLTQQNQQLSQQARSVPPANPNAEAEKQALISENEKLKMQLARQSENAQESSMMQQQAQSDLQTLQQENQSLKAQLSVAIAQSDQLEDEQTENLQVVLERVNTIESENTQLRQQILQQEEALAKANTEKAAAQNSKMAMERQLRELQVQVNQAIAEQGTKDEYSVLTAQMQRLSLEKDSVLTENNRLQKLNQLQEEQLAGMQTQLRQEQARQTDQQMSEALIAQTRQLSLEKDSVLNENKRLQALNISQEEQLANMQTQVRQAQAQQADQQASKTLMVQMQQLSLEKDSVLTENNRLQKMNALQEEQIAADTQPKVD
ncbi:MAG: hypothetical protein AAFQ87_13975, partial [Bacteroidota bacterium]